MRTTAHFSILKSAATQDITFDVFVVPGGGDNGNFTIDDDIVEQYVLYKAVRVELDGALVGYGIEFSAEQDNEGSAAFHQNGKALDEEFIGYAL